MSCEIDIQHLLLRKVFSVHTNFKPRLSLYKLRLNLYKLSLRFYKLSLSLEFLPIEAEIPSDGGTETSEAGEGGGTVEEFVFSACHLQV